METSKNFLPNCVVMRADLDDRLAAIDLATSYRAGSPGQTPVAFWKPTAPARSKAAFTKA